MCSSEQQTIKYLMMWSDLRVMVLELRLMLSGVVGLVTAHDCVPHFLLQLLRLFLSPLFHLETVSVLLLILGLSLYQAGMLSFARDLQTMKNKQEPILHDVSHL